MTWEQKAQALKAIAGDYGFALHMRGPGDWYVSLTRVEVSDGPDSVCVSSPTQSAATPQAAIEQAWEQHTTKAYCVIVNALNERRREVKWNGFMWEDVATRRAELAR